jgi:DNA-binding FadR family transcriptional regulator
MEPYVYDFSQPEVVDRHVSRNSSDCCGHAVRDKGQKSCDAGVSRGGVNVPATTGTRRQAIFAPLDDGSGRSEAVVRRLGSAIALGLIADGEQLPSEADLATSLGVATVTLREALSELRRRGLVETRRGRGGGSFVRVSEPALAALSRRRVRELGSADLRELGEFHAAVAGTAARLAAERASTHEIDRLSATLDRFEQAPTTAGWRRIEGRYYIEMAAAAQSVRLTRQEIELQSELAELQLFPPTPAGWATSMFGQHRAVLDAVGRRDGALARRLTEEHIGLRTLGMIEVHLALTVAAGDRLDVHSEASWTMTRGELDGDRPIN